MKRDCALDLTNPITNMNMIYSCVNNKPLDTGTKLNLNKHGVLGGNFLVLSFSDVASFFRFKTGSPYGGTS